MKCLQDLIPFGVFRETTVATRRTYRILGLAIVAGWEDGYYLLEGFSRSGEVRGKGPGPLIDAVTAGGEMGLDSEEFSPRSIADGRKRTIAAMIRRRGQPVFRKKLLAAYDRKWAITECDVEEVLEAAHIMPYRGPDTNHLANGLLLR